MNRTHHSAGTFLTGLCILLVTISSGCSSIQYRNVAPPFAAPVNAAVPRHAPVLALVLGGGASRGFAHVGVIKALEDHHIHPDIIVGTSAGSFVGALYAGGYHAAALEKIALELEESNLRDMTIPNRGFIKGELLQDFINRKLDNRSIEDLDLTFAAVATELQNGNRIIFTQGNTGMAVRASSSIPGIFQPVRINGIDYVDGGLTDPVPVDVARQLGADVVIAVDISRQPGDTVDFSSTLDVLLQTITIMGNSIAKFQAAGADVVIQPDVHLIGLQGFGEKQVAISAGEKAAIQALPAINSKLEQAGLN